MSKIDQTSWHCSTTMSGKNLEKYWNPSHQVAYCLLCNVRFLVCLKKKKKEKNLVKLFSALLFFPQSNMNSNWQKYLDIHWPNFALWQIKSNWWLPFYIFLHKPNKNITNMHCYFIGINFFRVIFLLYNVIPFLTIFLISNKIKY